MKAALARSLTLFILLTGGWLCASAIAQPTEPSSNQRFAQIVLFVPDDAEVPEDYQQRLHDIAIRTENFFADGIEQWDWDVARREVFARNSDGKVEITVARGELPKDATGRKGFPLVMPLAMEAATEALGDKVDESTVWWVFYHTPERVIKGFRGGGDRDGGRAINVYPTADGEISPTVELGDPKMWPLNLKGCLHEFGHALGLPHIGPKPSSELGNTLMGPINRAFGNRLPEGTTEPRVFLCEASAALLAKHPLFVSRGPIASAGQDAVAITDLTFEETSDHSIQISGKVSGATKAHSIVVLDSDRRFGDYWSRSYTASVDEGGKFLVSLEEPFDASKGVLMLYICLKDGRNKAAEPEGAMRFEYNGSPGKRTFSAATREE